MTNEPSDSRDQSAPTDHDAELTTGDHGARLGVAGRFMLPPSTLAHAKAQLAAQEVHVRARAETPRAAVELPPLVTREPEGLCAPRCDGHFPDLLALALALHR
ncbi:MAG: hypothetical protein K0V04_17285 [Deltaproteobacteria bacterium]|nr:hypothetical protein [Deltaproteobacteria bacterium]